MSVVIVPSEQLEFHRPLTRTNTEYLFVKNPNPTPVIFKVKTTAPKQYCVRPNAGRIEGNSEIEVQIILQAFKEEPAEDYKCKDKFLVQTAPISEALEQLDITRMWAHVETEERESMRQHKIKCAFLPAKEEEEDQSASQGSPIQASSAVPPAALSNLPPAPAVTAPIPAPAPAPAPVPETISSTSSSFEKPIINEVPSPKLTTTAANTNNINTTNTTNTTATTTATTNPVSDVQKSPVPPPVPAPRTRNIVTDEKKTTNASAPIPAVSAVDNSETAAELKAANETIKRLQKQLEELRQEEQTLRSRNTTTATPGGRKLASTVQPLDAVHQHLAALEKPRPTEGYPPQVVLGVAALVFIFTYIFF